MMKFKIGDKVKVIDEKVDRHLIGMVGEVVEHRAYTFDVDFGKPIKQSKNKVNDTTHIFYHSELELLKSGKTKPEKPEDLTRYMVYGTGCNNKGELLLTESELKEDLRRKVKDSSWTGRIIGYKLVPIYEGELTTKLKTLKPVKIKKKK